LAADCWQASFYRGSAQAEIDLALERPRAVGDRDAAPT